MSLIKPPQVFKASISLQTSRLLKGFSCRLPLFALCLFQSQICFAQEVDSNVDTKDQSINRKNLFQSQFPSMINPENNTINYDYSIFDSCIATAPNIINKQTKSYNPLKNNDKKNITSKNISIKADDIPINTEDMIRLTGNISMITDSSLLKADELIQNKKTGVDQANGNITLETAESLLQAKDFLNDRNTQTMTLSDVDYRYFAINGNGKAEKIEVNQSAEVSILKDLTFTTCPNGDKSWLFSADELSLDASKGWAEAWGMWFKIKGIPIFYFPYFNFAIDDRRKSGFLLPDISRNNRNGLDVKLPIYWNIQSNMDATFIPRNIANRGNQLGIEYRYLTEQTSNKLSIEALPNDALASRSLLSNPELADGRYGLRNERWGIAVSNETRWNKNWSASMQVNKVSDRDYFRDLGVGLINQNASPSEPLLESYGNISYIGDTWSNSLILDSTQSLVGQEPYRKTPSFISHAEYFDQSHGIFWEFNSELANFTHSDKTRVHGIRINIKPELSIPFRNAYAWAIPKLAFQSTHYEQSYPLGTSTNAGVEEKLSLSRSLPIFSFDTGLIFDRKFSIKRKQSNQSDSGFQEQENQVIIHTLEPRLFYSYIPFKDQSEINNFDTRLPDFNFNQLWRANRFSGNDRIGDTNHVALAVTNRFTDNESGKEIASISVGRKYFFERRRVTLAEPMNNNRIEPSALLAEFSYRANSQLELSTYIEWDDSNTSDGLGKGTRKARSRVKYEPYANHVVNLSHRVRNELGNQSEEVDLSFLWPVNERWRIVGKWYNDLKNKRTLETLFGLEYKSCCWAVSLVSRRYLDVRLDAFGNPIDIDSSQGLANEFENSIRLDFNVIFGQKSPKSSGVAKLIRNSIRDF